MTTLEKIRAEIKTKYDSIPWRDNDYNDGWVEALEWVYDDVLDKYAEQEPKQPDICPIYDGMCGYPIEFCYECPRHPEQEPSDTIAYHDDFATALIKISEYEDRKRCEDAVSRQAVQDTIEDWLMSDDFDKRDLVQRLHGRINELPSVQPKRNE